jgi:tetratricopeptide (TPR) repeat protein
VKFFREELFPFIDSNYRSQDYRIVIGPQAGAVFSFYSLLNHPDLFQAYILENPFVWQNREILYSLAEKKLTDKGQLNRFLYIREERNSQPQHVKTATEFSERIGSKAPAGFRFRFSLEDPSGYFVAPAPAKEGLQLLFSPFVIPDSMRVLTIDEIKSFYQNSSLDFGISFNIPEHVLTMKSDELMTAGRYSDQASLLEYMLSVYPRSLNALLRMGDLKRTLGDHKEAIRLYDEFLKIMPVDAVAIRNRRNSIEKYINESLVYVLEKDIQSLGIDKAIRNFKRAKGSEENLLKYEENDLNSLGYSLLNKGMNDESIKVFKLALDIYPNSANLFDSLGEAYMKSGDNKGAVINYEKSLDLNPDNNNAKEMLNKLKK